jgi:hypothetical protein
MMSFLLLIDMKRQKTLGIDRMVLAADHNQYLNIIDWLLMPELV